MSDVQAAVETPDDHEWIHDASCTQCGARARAVVFDPHPLDPLPGGLVDKSGLFWPTCRRCGRIHYNQWPDRTHLETQMKNDERRIYMNRVNALEAYVATLTAERDRYYGALLATTDQRSLEGPQCVDVEYCGICDTEGHSASIPHGGYDDE